MILAETKSAWYITNVAYAIPFLTVGTVDEIRIAWADLQANPDGL